MHTVVVRVDWRNPEQQAKEGFHRTWFNWGGLDGEVTVRQIGASELSEPTLQTTLSGSDPSAGPAHVRLTVMVRNDSSARTSRPPGRSRGSSEVIPLSFRPLNLAHGQTASDTATVDDHEPGAVVDRPPEHVHVVARSAG